MFNVKYMDIDLRKEMSELMEDNYYWVLVQRVSHKVRCKCYNEKFLEGTSKCPICLGTGYIFKFDKVKTFNQSISIMLEKLNYNTNIGSVLNNAKTFFFEETVKLNVGDYIWEVAWERDTPVKLNHLYLINSYQEKRGFSGRIEFNVATTKLEVIDKDFKNMYIGKAWKERT